MDIIKAGIGITKTIRNIGRLQEIVTVFAKNGFDEFITRGVTTHIPDFVLPRSRVQLKAELAGKEQEDIQGILGKRLRMCFEELGPSFIKIGQLLSSREDLFAPSFIGEMKVLRDQVKGIPFSEAKKIIEVGLGGAIEDFFQHLHSEPVGTASIGVVYAAVLKGGDKVVIKVRRPQIAKMIATDLEIFLFVMGQAEKISDEIKYLGITNILQDFAHGLENEINFHTEALNCRRLQENLSKHDHQGIFYLPKIYDEFTKDNILVMEYIEGIAFTKNLEIRAHLKELEPNLQEGIKLLLKSFLQDGFFHADLHGGNFFLLPNQQIGLIDFGLMGSLSKKGRINFIAIVYSLLTYNFENLVYEFIDVAEYESIPDVEMLIHDVRQVLTPFIGLSVKQIDMSLILKLITTTLRKHKIFLPREWIIVFRALITLDGVGKSLGIDFDLFEILEGNIKEIIKGTINRDDLLEEGIWAGRDLVALMRIFPRHLKWFMREWSKKNYAMEISHINHGPPFYAIAGAIIFLGLALVASLFIGAGLYLVRDHPSLAIQEIPVLCWVYWGLGAFLLFFGHRIFAKYRP